MAFSFPLLVGLLGHSLAAPVPVERSLDWTLKNVGTLRVSNSRGRVEVRGWAQDRLRALWATTSDRPETVEVHIQEVQGRIEVTVRYGAGMPVAQKLKERTQPIAKSDLILFAPSRYPLEVLGVDEAIQVNQWRASAELRSLQGNIGVTGFQGKRLAVQCPACRVQLDQVVARSLQIHGGRGGIFAQNTRSEDGFLSTSEGEIRVQGGSGTWVAASSSGPVNVDGFRGGIEFLTGSGGVKILEHSGFLSGRSLSGGIQAEVKEWIFRDRAFLESQSGPVELTLPRSFVGELEVKGGAAFGRPEIGFDLSQARENQGRIQGVVRQATELLRVVSEEGKVAVLRAESGR